MASPPVMQFGPEHAWFDASRAPYIIMRVPAVVGDDMLEGALREVSRWLLEDVNALFSFVANFERPLKITARQRRMMANAERQYAHVDRTYNAGQAVIVQSPMTRGVLTAVYWLSPPVYPYAFFSDMESAFSWLVPQFEHFAAAYPNGRHEPVRRSMRG